MVAFAIVAFISVLGFTFAESTKDRILWFWFNGMSMGGCYWSFGNAFLGLFVWMLTLFSTFAWLLFATLFGLVAESVRQRYPRLRRLLIGFSTASLILGLLIGGNPESDLQLDWLEWGKMIAGQQGLTLSILAVSLFVILIASSYVLGYQEESSSC